MATENAALRGRAAGLEEELLKAAGRCAEVEETGEGLAAEVAALKLERGALSSRVAAMEGELTAAAMREGELKAAGARQVEDGQAQAERAGGLLRGLQRELKDRLFALDGRGQAWKAV